MPRIDEIQRELARTESVTEVARLWFDSGLTDDGVNLFLQHTPHWDESFLLTALLAYGDGWYIRPLRQNPHFPEALRARVAQWYADRLIHVRTADGKRGAARAMTQMVEDGWITIDSPEIRRLVRKMRGAPTTNRAKFIAFVLLQLPRIDETLRRECTHLAPAALEHL